uniref:ATP synthase epsilon chain, chloroplastic n=1 Tax=Cyanidiococcus yangmingshanensis TaxID=2690220 RepID=A0A7G5VUP4_9RHOD|nr:ATP synthase CF1 epsilon subunit [Cyanidiococcus yangmingshanensis]QMX77411.1 ATP synthase CF1 epsilon subunit [Cyanidiococcus yangmingshanensis]UNJ16026.1 ATP synthase CF1 epsilon subunit [Cyanidioschyzonaceae sp. 3]WDB00483.1 ATP synthase CF1 epsilon subunit [Cyanidiococcus yangmingshanensis]
MKIKVITPDRYVWDREFDEVILPSSTGQLGILPNHAPLLTALDIGVMRARTAQGWVALVLFGGFAEVLNNQITILVNGAQEVHEIHLQQAQEEELKALQQLEQAQTPTAQIEAKQNLAKWRARVQAANYANSN